MILGHLVMFGDWCP